MAWFTRFTRFGDVHLVHAQENLNSCGISCAVMAVFKINKFRPTRKFLYKEKQIYKVYSKVSGTKYDGTAYSNGFQLAKTLNQLNVGKWKCENVGGNKVIDAITDSLGTDNVLVKLSSLSGRGVTGLLRGHPIILHVGWNAGGAHFVLVDTVNSFAGKKYASICDPWDGDVHIIPMTSGQSFPYVAKKNPWSWDLGGKRYEYKNSQNGAASGWVIHRVD